MKKRDNLLEAVKKNYPNQLLSFLDNKDLLMLSLSSKKYYAALYPLIASNQLDQIKSEKNNKASKNKNKKNKKQKKVQNQLKQIEVQVQKISLSKWHKIKQNNLKLWEKVDNVEVSNSYLQKKIASKSFIFYKNLETNQLIYINRSLVDPCLNYNKGGFGENFIQENIYEELYEEGNFNENDFSSQEALLKRQREILEKIDLKKQAEKVNEEINYNEELQKAVHMKKLGIILCFGGSFSFGIFENGKCLMHKSDKKYVCRKKAGERQFNKDKQSGTSIKSMGSQIRRDQQKKHVINVGEILTEHKKDLEECEVILLQAPGLNRLFIINENENLDGLQDRLRSVCVTAKKANFTEIEALYQAISYVNIVTIKNQAKAQESQS